MVKTLEIDTPQAVIVVQEPTGFDPEGRYKARLQLALAQHIAGVETLPPTAGEIDALVNQSGWDAIIKYTRMVDQTRCVQWKAETLFVLPSIYATYPVHCATFDSLRFVDSTFLKAWTDGIEQVSQTERDVVLEGKPPGE